MVVEEGAEDEAVQAAAAQEVAVRAAEAVEPEEAADRRLLQGK